MKPGNSIPAAEMVNHTEDQDQAQSSLSFKPANPDPSTPSYTFTQIIDADHLTIQSLAAKTRRILSAISKDSTDTNVNSSLTASLLPILHEITWRLIRHDLSESLVMRPAFIATLPSPQGQEMADHDARDHADGRTLLLSIIDRLRDPTDLAEIGQQVIRAFDDLGKHMAIESGEFLPYFEKMIDEETSRRLAREYTESLCMTPFLCVPEDGIEVKKVFENVTAYVRIDPPELKAIYEALVVKAGNDEMVRMALRAETEKELDRLQVWKWRSLTMNNAASMLTANSKTDKHRTTKL